MQEQASRPGVWRRSTGPLAPWARPAWLRPASRALPLTVGAAPNGTARVAPPQRAAARLRLRPPSTARASAS